MFRKLKIKLVLINLALICMVLFLVFAGINWYVGKRAQDRALSVLHTAAQDIDSLQERLSKVDRAIMLSYFFIITDKKGQVVEASINAPEEPETIVVAALKKTDDEGKLSYNQSKLWYLKVSQADGNLLVFLQDEGGSAMLESLKDISLVIGGISVLLALLISFVLANRALLPIRAAWEKQEAFVADASHELRTPLAVLNTNLDAVMDSPDENVASQSEWLTNMKNEIARMSRLVNDLLFLARVDGKSEAIQREKFSMSDLLKKAAASFLPLMEERGLTLKQSIQVGVEMIGAESRIHQLIVILLDNAIKSTPSKGSINMVLRAQDGKAHIEIADTGIGIPAEQLEHIFERFYRTDLSRTREEGGTGLGLSIAKCIIHEHHGKVSVQSEVGTGTVFKIVFPV